MYNSEKYIKKCLDSIYSQDIPEDEFEIIIVNDGSTDESSMIIEEYSKEHKNLTLKFQKNAGQSAARNRGIELAKGKFLWFVDADDFLIPNSLKRVYDSIFNDYTKEHQHTVTQDAMQKEYCNCDIITFDIIKGDENQFDSDGFIQTNPIFYPVVKGWQFIDSADYRFPNGPWWYFISRDFINSNNLRFAEGKLLEDGLFITSALLSASKVGRISYILYFYAIRSGSTMYTYTDAQLKRLEDSFRYAITYMTDVIQKHREEINEGCYVRLLSRRNSYIVFLLIRLLKFSGIRTIDSTLKRLKHSGLYPIKHFIGKDYNSWRIRSAFFIINKEYLYKLTYFLYCLARNVKKLLYNKKIE